MKEIERRAESQRPVLQQYSTVARELVDNLKRSGNNAVEVSERMKDLVNEAPEVSQKQIGRADRVFEEDRQIIPGRHREAIPRNSGIPAASRTALGVFFGHNSTPTAGVRGTRNSSLSGWLILAVLLPTFRCLTPVLNAQQSNEQISYEGQKVAVVKLVARPGVDVEALRPLALQKEGEAYSADKVQSTVAALQQTGQFSKIDVEVTPEATGLRVMFVMQPVYYVGMINFPGALETFSYPRLLQVINYPNQEPYDESRVKAAEPVLRSYFANNGYFTAQLESETKLDDVRQLADVVFHVTLNKRAKFGRVGGNWPPA